MHEVEREESSRVVRQRDAARRYRAKWKNDPEYRARKQANEKRARVRNPERFRAYEKRRKRDLAEVRPWLRVFRAARRRATKFGMEFQITAKWAEEKYKDGSSLSGLPFQPGYGPFSVSIDRIDSAKDYTPENCRLILLAENLFKNEWSDDVVLTISKAIAERINV